MSAPPSAMSGNLIPCMINQLDLFRKQPVQACISNRMVEKLKPLSALPELPDVIEFLCPGRPLHFLDLNNLTLRVVVYTRKKQTKAKMGVDVVNNSVVDCTMHSLFSQCEIFLSEQPVTKSPHLYGYKSLFDIYTTAGKDARDGPLSTVIVRPDSTPEKTDDKSPWNQRMKIFAKSQHVELVGKIRADVCELENGSFILDNVPLRVRLTVQPQEFFLWSTAEEPDVELVFVDVELLVPFFIGQSELGMGLDMALNEKPATYRFKGSQLKTFFHPARTTNLMIPVAFSGKLPSTILFTMVKAADFNGDIGTNPYKFPHFGIQELSFFCNGVEKRFQMDMTTPQGCSTVLRSLYNDFGHELEEAGGHVFNLQSLTDGRFACAVDLTADHTGRAPSQNLDQYGTVRIQARMKEPLDHAVCIILYARYDNIMEISASREITIF